MKIKKSFWVSIGIIILLGIIAYGLFSPWFGFYYNDWHPILGQISGTSLKTLFEVDRPALGTVYTYTVQVLGNNPILWQGFSIALRIFSAIGLFTILIQHWPNFKLGNFLASVLFLIYPGFMQQPIALTFSNHLISLCLGLFSISIHIFSLTYPFKRRKTLIKAGLMLFAMGMSGLYLLLYEYMIGLELVRWVIIWYLLIKENKSTPFIRRTGLWLKKIWLFFLPVIGLIYYRFFHFVSTRPTMNVDSLVSSYADQPLLILQNLIFEMIQAISNTILFAYVVPLYTRLKNTNVTLILVGFLLSFGLSFLVWWFLSKKSTVNQKQSGKLIEQYANEFIVLGIIFVFVTLAPVVVTGRNVSFENLLDRYTLQSSFGVAMLFVGLGERLIHQQKYRLIFFSGLVFISLFFHFSNGIFWQNHWNYQRQLFWQVYWRAPRIKPDTVVMALQPEGYLFREDEDVYAPLNYIYYPDQGFIHIVSEVLSNETVDDLLNQTTTYRSYRTVGFKRVFSQALVVSNTNPNTCVHIIDGEHPELIQNEAALIKLAAPYSRINQIMADRSWEREMPALFGNEPEHAWCYYYQKADLARQLADWEEIKNLGDQAKAEKFTPNDSSEWYPFMEGYAGVGDWESAQEVIDLIHEDDNRTDTYCRTHLGYADYNDFRAELYQRICSLED